MPNVTAMFAIVASMKATAPPGDAIASTVRGEDLPRTVSCSDGPAALGQPREPRAPPATPSPAGPGAALMVAAGGSWRFIGLSLSRGGITSSVGLRVGLPHRLADLSGLRHALDRRDRCLAV